MTNEEGSASPEERPGGSEELDQDPLVKRLRSGPSEPPQPVRMLVGFSGESDREGHWRLYFTRELDSYAEFRREDIVYSEPIPREQAPHVGYDATRVGIKRDATIEYTQVRTPRYVDEFDLDIKLGGRYARPGAAVPQRRAAEDTQTQQQCDPYTCWQLNLKYECVWNTNPPDVCGENTVPPWDTCYPAAGCRNPWDKALTNYFEYTCEYPPATCGPPPSTCFPNSCDWGF